MNAYCFFINLRSYCVTVDTVLYSSAPVVGGTPKPKVSDPLKSWWNCVCTAPMYTMCVGRTYGHLWLLGVEFVYILPTELVVV